MFYSIPEDGERKNLLEKHSQTEPAQMDNGKSH